MICPRCLGSDTKRHGYDRRRRQCYYCRSCKRQWTHGAPKRIPRDHPTRQAHPWPKLICYHCGSTRCDPVRRRKRSGVQARCLACGRNFTQGGPEDLRRYSVCLRERIRAAGHVGEMADEILANAIVDVLSGNAYCWNVPLRKPTLQGSGRGDWGRGSDHPAIKEANGIKDEW